MSEHPSKTRREQIEILKRLEGIAASILPDPSVFGVLHFYEDGPDGHFNVPVMKYVEQGMMPFYDGHGYGFPMPDTAAFTVGMYLTLVGADGRLFVRFVETKCLAASDDEWAARMRETYELLVAYVNPERWDDLPPLIDDRTVLYRRDDIRGPDLPRPGETLVSSYAPRYTRNVLVTAWRALEQT